MVKRVNAELEDLIATLGLRPLPHEGGYFRRTWHSRLTTANGRALASSIYFLLTADDFSALHQIDAEETWHFYAGDVVEHVQFDVPRRQVAKARLGADIRAGERPQIHVPAGGWQGARVVAGGARGWALVGCTVTPAWEAGGFALAPDGFLAANFPAERPLIQALTR